MRPSAVVLVADQKSKASFLRFIEQQNNVEYQIDSVVVFSDLTSLTENTDGDVSVYLCYQLFIPFYLFKQLIDFCVPLQRQLRIIDSDFSQPNKIRLRDLTVDDMFMRDTGFDSKTTSSKLVDQCILVTGGAGSIGSQLCRTLCHNRPQKLIIADQNEAALWALQQELSSLVSKTDVVFLLLDITNPDELSYLFEQYSFTIVIHAAAYKQLPLLQNNLFAANNTNLMATVNLANLAIKHSVAVFLNLSTDKAVLPTSHLGTTKRAAELYLSHLNNQAHIQTRLYSVRLGNVIGTVGSVVPLFKDQLRNKLPLTITHLEAARYFIANKSVSELLLTTLWLDQEESVLIFNMTEAVKINDLASVLTSLYLAQVAITDTPKTEVIGLRAGEKLTETLYYPEAKLTKTTNSNIFAVKETIDQIPDIAGIVSTLASINKPSKTQEIEKLLQSVLAS
ncbi:MAG: SDR family NAD(P)-dependent oxidoreductase [Gilvibacter sp.]